MDLINVILSSGKSAVNLALYILLPTMIVMMFLVRLLEVYGVVAWFSKLLGPLLKFFGLNGFSLIALVQMNFVSFAAPIPTLSMMERRGVSDRHLASTMAMTLSMAQANVLYPAATIGLNFISVLIVSILGGIIAASLTWYLFGRSLSSSSLMALNYVDELKTEKRLGILAIISDTGVDAFKIATGTLPMLILSLSVLGVLTQLGVIDFLKAFFTPVFEKFNANENILTLIMTKYLAGGTAVTGVINEFHSKGGFDSTVINNNAGLLINAFDLPGSALLISAGKRISKVFIYAVPGIVVAIGTRSTIHMLGF